MSKVSPSIGATQAWCSDGLPTLFERYRVLGILGQGGMGTVFKGYHINLKRFVAIKTLRIDSIKSPELVNRFLREMEVVGQMDHPNVVRASDAGEKNGVFHLVMEYLTGSDLAHLVAERGPLGVADACAAARQAALGLAHIHQMLVHRDIKPSNLMLTTSGVVKILDLGLARLHESDDRERTPAGYVMGTYDYMAPEQATGQAQIDGRADIYSLGCTLFKLLTGRPPFSGPSYDTLAKKLFAHCHTPLTAVEKFQSIPEGLQAVLLRMTAKNPAERYPSALEVAEVLAPFAAGSRLPELLAGSKRAVETGVQPLPQPLPEELSRLTESARETVLKTPSAPGRLPEQALPRGWRRPVLGIGLLAFALAGLAWFLAPTLLNRRGENDTKELAPAGTEDVSEPRVRLLDELPVRTYHPLLDQLPIPIGCAGPANGKWRWDRSQQFLEAHGPDSLLFELGTTSRASFSFEAGVVQSPWAGKVGIFWGYHENAAVKKARAPGQAFARFQMLSLWHRIGDKGGNVYSVRRGKGALAYDVNGEVQLEPSYSEKHDVPLLDSGEKILVIAVERNRLSRAFLGSVELTSLYSTAANKTFASEPYQGAIGLLSLGYQATFRNVRFIAQSN